MDSGLILFYSPKPECAYLEAEWNKNKIFMIGNFLPQDLVFNILKIKIWLSEETKIPELVQFKDREWGELKPQCHLYKLVFKQKYLGYEHELIPKYLDFPAELDNKIVLKKKPKAKEKCVIQ